MILRLRQCCAILLGAAFCGLTGCWGRKPPPLGLVLSGGGAKGAYEIGVWKALCELGLDGRITAISGTSVGAINAAIFASVQDPVRCSALWRDVSSRAFRPNYEVIGGEIRQTIDDFDELQAQARSRQVRAFLRKHGRKPTEEELAQLDGGLTVEDGVAMGLKLLLRATDKAGTAVAGGSASRGFCSSEKLRQELMNCIPERWPSSAPQVYATAVDKKSSRARVFALRGLPRPDVVTRIMASAAIPGAFDAVLIDGSYYVDGGFEAKGGENVPVTPILQRNPEIRTIIVVKLAHDSGDVRTDGADGVRIVTVTPSEDIAGRFCGWQGVFDVSAEKCERMFQLGYRDAKQALRGL